MSDRNLLLPEMESYALLCMLFMIYECKILDLELACIKRFQDSLKGEQ